jgi:hypothetical protein
MPNRLQRVGRVRDYHRVLPRLSRSCEVGPAKSCCNGLPKRGLSLTSMPSILGLSGAARTEYIRLRRIRAALAASPWRPSAPRRASSLTTCFIVGLRGHCIAIKQGDARATPMPSQKPEHQLAQHVALVGCAVAAEHLRATQYPAFEHPGDGQELRAEHQAPVWRGGHAVVPAHVRSPARGIDLLRLSRLLARLSPAAGAVPHHLSGKGAETASTRAGAGSAGDQGQSTAGFRLKAKPQRRSGTQCIGTVQALSGLQGGWLPRWRAAKAPHLLDF